MFFLKLQTAGCAPAVAAEGVDKFLPPPLARSGRNSVRFGGGSNSSHYSLVASHHHLQTLFSPRPTLDSPSAAASASANIWTTYIHRLKPISGRPTPAAPSHRVSPSSPPTSEAGLPTASPNLLRRQLKPPHRIRRRRRLGKKLNLGRV